MTAYVPKLYERKAEEESELKRQKKNPQVKNCRNITTEGVSWVGH